MNTNDNQPDLNTVPMSEGDADVTQTMLQAGMLQAPARPGARGAVGRFEILRPLATGGMGQVFLAREPITESRVAIKMIRPRYRSEEWVVRRFLTEAQHMYRMSHPNILKVMEVSDRKEGPYYVMPFVEGGSLAQAIKPGKPLPEDRILEIARQVAEALKYAHSRGIIHRDLKPANVLLDKEGRAYLTDFGLLRTVFNDAILDPDQSAPEGTAAYMSPLAASGKAEDTRCDIYAFGAVLYEMLTGSKPYEGQNPRAIVDKILAGPPRPIREINRGAPPALVRIAESCMARELRDRYAEMADVVRDLERVARGEEPLGPHGQPAKPGAALRTQKQSVGKFMAITGASLLLAGFVGVLLGFATLYGIDMMEFSADMYARARAMRAATLPIKAGVYLGLAGWFVLSLALACRYRAPWFYRLMRVMAVVWLLFFPWGWIVTCFYVLHLLMHKKEFFAEPPPARSRRILFSEGFLILLLAVGSVFIGNSTFNALRKHTSIREPRVTLNFREMPLSHIFTLYGKLVGKPASYPTGTLEGLQGTLESGGPILPEEAIRRIEAYFSTLGLKIIQDRHHVSIERASPASLPPAWTTSPVVTEKNVRSAESLCAQGWRVWREQRYEEAEELFRQAAEKNPGLADAWNGLGWSRQNMGLTANAKVAFERCIALDGKHAGALNGLGWIAKNERKLHEAIRHWELAVAAAPQATAALAGLASTHFELGYYDLAAKHARNWLDLEPGNAEAQRILTEAQARLQETKKQTPEEKRGADAARDPNVTAIWRRWHKQTTEDIHGPFFDHQQIPAETRQALEEATWTMFIRQGEERRRQRVPGVTPEQRAQIEQAIQNLKKERDDAINRLLQPGRARVFLQYEDGIAYRKILRDFKASLAEKNRTLPLPVEWDLMKLMWSVSDGLNKLSGPSGRDNEPLTSPRWREEFLSGAKSTLDEQDGVILSQVVENPPPRAVRRDEVDAAHGYVVRNLKTDLADSNRTLSEQKEAALLSLMAVLDEEQTRPETMSPEEALQFRNQWTADFLARATDLLNAEEHALLARQLQQFNSIAWAAERWATEPDAVEKGSPSLLSEPRIAIQFREATLQNVAIFYAQMTGKSVILSPQVDANRLCSLQSNGRIPVGEAAQLVEAYLSAGGLKFTPVGENSLRIDPLVPEATSSAPAAIEAPPRIVNTMPAIGATEVDPAVAEITVTFDSDMAGGFSWTGGGPDYPPLVEGRGPYWRDSRTCVLPVKLEAGHYYRVGINSKSHRNFRSRSGTPTPPSAIYFTTRGAGDELKVRAQKPVVLEMTPANGAEGVDPAITELRVTFSVPMGGGFSWTGGGPEYPVSPENKGPYWTEDQRTCVLPVRLEPNHSYRLGLNSFSHKNFQSAAGVPLEPVTYTFRTAAEAP